MLPAASPTEFYKSCSFAAETDPFRKICVSETLPADNDELKPLYMWVVFDLEDGTFDVYNYSTYYSISYNPDGDYFETYDYTLDDFINLYPSLVPAE